MNYDLRSLQRTQTSRSNLHMRYSDIELESLLADIESDLSERKEAFAGDARETIRQAVCAFANDLPWIRVGPRRAIANGQDERILIEKRRFRDRTFDAHPLASATLADLSQRVFEQEYLPAAFAPDVIAANDRSYEQRLAATKMIASADQPVPTIAGILVLGNRSRDFVPGAYVQFLRVAGITLSDPIQDAAQIDGTISETIRRLEEKLDAHNQTAVDITSTPREVRIPMYPQPALQQLVRNGVLHRTYEGTNAPVRVTWFEDRIEIASPGGPFGAVTVENFGQPGWVDYRNPVLAEAMRVLGFVNRFGVGISTARESLARNGNPPLELSAEPNWVLATVRKRL